MGGGWFAGRAFCPVGRGALAAAARLLIVA